MLNSKTKIDFGLEYLANDTKTIRTMKLFLSLFIFFLLSCNDVTQKQESIKIALVNNIEKEPHMKVIKIDNLKYVEKDEIGLLGYIDSAITLLKSEQQNLLDNKLKLLKITKEQAQLYAEQFGTADLLTTIKIKDSREAAIEIGNMIKHIKSMDSLLQKIEVKKQSIKSQKKFYVISQYTAFIENRGRKDTLYNTEAVVNQDYNVMEKEDIINLIKL